MMGGEWWEDKKLSPKWKTVIGEGVGGNTKKGKKHSRQFRIAPTWGKRCGTKEKKAEEYEQGNMLGGKKQSGETSEASKKKILK